MGIEHGCILSGKEGQKEKKKRETSRDKEKDGWTETMAQRETNAVMTDKNKTTFKC